MEKELSKQYVTRYEIIANYPGCPWFVGRILTEIRPGVYNCLEAPASVALRQPYNYPHLFKQITSDNTKQG